jgi:5-methylcytosine-specific restriction endonuclease McrA
MAGLRMSILGACGRGAGLDMPNLKQLSFWQGGKCFLCGQVINDGEQTIEHLVPQSLGGKNVDENCVMVCKTVNGLLGNKTYKEKLEVVLKNMSNQGRFKCPKTNGGGKD